MSLATRARLAALALLAVTACASPGELHAVHALDGSPRDPFAGDFRALVLLFVDVDCPISNAYSPEIRRLAADYGPRGVDIELVYAAPGRDVETVRRHAGEYDLGLPVLLDLEHELLRRSEVTTTPEAAVFLPDGSLGYRGRIDDRYAVLGSRRAQPSRHDLREALDAVLAGRRPEVERTEPIGCPIPSVRGRVTFERKSG